MKLYPPYDPLTATSDMDPLSLTASIAGLVGLADVVFRTGHKYYKAAKESQTDVKNLLDEVKALSLLLHQLSFVATESVDGLTPEQIAAGRRSHFKADLLHGSQEILVSLQETLDKENNDFE